MEVEHASQGPGQPTTAAPPSAPLATASDQQPAPTGVQATKRTSRRQGRTQRRGWQQDPTADTDEEDTGSQGSLNASTQDDEDGYSDQQSMQAGSPDPLYDPDADEEDEQYLQQQRGGRTSDAILSCPGCFTTLCIDCQQHSLYKHQYRAMFVMNCLVDSTKLVGCSAGSAPVAGQKRGRGGEEGSNTERKQPMGNTADAGTHHPVMCEVCRTEVGVVEPGDGLYTFFNACPSNA